MSLRASFGLELGPSQLLVRAGIGPDPWQDDLLGRRPRRARLVTSRQVGKSLTAAALALWLAMTEQRALILVASPTQRQSAELVAKLRDLLAFCPEIAVDQESALRITLLSTGSRIVALPGTEATIRGYSAPRAVILDEAAFIQDGLPVALTPMLATVPDSILWALSTPNGRTGWLHERWAATEAGDEHWDLIRLPATDVPRISPEFLDEERARMTDARFRSEYMAEFVDVERSLFLSNLIDDATTPTTDDSPPAIVFPTFGESP